MIHLKRVVHPLKPHSVRIYSEIQSDFGFIKQYIHPIDTSIKAYARQLSANEQMSSDAVRNASEYEFTIWKREIKEDMYIEFDNGFGTKVYQIGSPDLFEFFRSEIKFRATEVTPKTYIETRWT
jgi:hypothetical protein